MKLFRAIGYWFGVYDEWIGQGDSMREFLGMAIPCLLGAALLVGIIVLLIVVFVGNPPVPTIHLNGACQQLYQGVSTKYGMDYSPVNVCP